LVVDTISAIAPSEEEEEEVSEEEQDDEMEYGTIALCYSN
jgi:hypothetical protein